MRSLLRSLVFACAFTTAWAAHAERGADVPGAADHPLIKRFSGSWLAGQRVSGWDAAAVPAAPKVQKADKYKFEELVELEGLGRILDFLRLPCQLGLERLIRLGLKELCHLERAA